METEIRKAISSRSDTPNGGYLARYNPTPAPVSANSLSTPPWQRGQRLHPLPADSAIARTWYDTDANGLGPAPSKALDDLKVQFTMYEGLQNMNRSLGRNNHCGRRIWDKATTYWALMHSDNGQQAH
ncbi:hypothetical protein DL546_006373 [Coniochaeta pulveracea]|uniref:Uncharacterized protein n=1 Tax=Coniochaeta pulveracea TaxID=177199 RepID=A0A420Y4S8_9PEZI|nr:hypothetical protein DL546_006373 [Coniochaeta pulveracea]